MSLDTLLKAARYIEQQELRHRLCEEEPAAALLSLPAAAAPRNGVVLPRVTLHAAPASTSPHHFLQHNLHSTITRNTSPGATSGGAGPAGAGLAGCGVRSGTREVHNKLEKNRRAHLKECFELLKRQLPASDDKKASNLAILGSANRYIQVLRRKERECEHEMERLAREKIAAQQRLAALRRDASLRTAPAADPHQDSHTDSGVSEERRARDERVNGHVVAIPVSIKSPGCGTNAGAGSLTTNPVVGPLAIAPHQNGVSEKLSGGGGGAGALLHPAHVHLSQMVRGGVALQLVGGAGAGGLRLLHRAALTTRRDELGIITAVSTDSGSSSVVVTPLVVSQAQLLHAHTLTHKEEPQLLGAQYMGGTLMKPLVVVSAPAPPPHPPPHT